MCKALTHTKCRAMLCLICVLKKAVRPISEVVRQQIKTYHHAGLDHINDDRLPTSICVKCRLHLGQLASGKRVDKLPMFDYKLLDHPPQRRNGMYCY